MPREVPIVLVLDDLHAADTPSLLLLKFIAGQIADMHTIVLATYRDIELAPDDPVTAALTDVSRAPAPVPCGSAGSPGGTRPNSFR